ncbi:MAG: EamA family transporter [Alphaproteobacteria bacterium]|nr:EamA family transporter [Alphaproteobacteria bacterium]
MTQDEKPARRDWRNPSPTLRGVLWMLFGCVAFAGMGATVRYLTRLMPPQELIFFRNALALVWMFPWIARVGFAALRTSHFGMYAGRSLLAFISMLCWFTALVTLPLAEAIALGFTQPLFSTVLAVLILGEVVRVRRWTATIIGFLGAMVILRPGIESVTFAHLLVLGSSLTGAITSVVVKQLTRTEDPNTIVTYMTLLTTPFALLIALPVWEWPDATTWIWLFVLGLLATLGHQASTRAFKYLDASLAVSLDFIRLPLAALVAWIAFAETPDIWTWIGGAIIAASSVYIARREAQLARERQAARIAAAQAAGGADAHAERR